MNEVFSHLTLYLACSNDTVILLGSLDYIPQQEVLAGLKILNSVSFTIGAVRVLCSVLSVSAGRVLSVSRVFRGQPEIRQNLQAE